jgi:hypothetical protein
MSNAHGGRRPGAGGRLHNQNALIKDRSRPQLVPRGGRRPGGGPPAGNLNALKTGRFSMQLVRALLASDPRLWKRFRARKRGNKYRARLNMAAAILWIRIGASMSGRRAQSLR